MIIIDELLKAREAQKKPIRVGMLGAGFMGQGLTNQITNSVPGMRMVAVYNRKPQRALDVFTYSGSTNPIQVSTQTQLDEAIRAGRPAVTEDAFLLARSEQIDLLVDV